jgi:hypothetical protein
MLCRLACVIGLLTAVSLTFGCSGRAQPGGAPSAEQAAGGAASLQPSGTGGNALQAGMPPMVNAGAPPAQEPSGTGGSAGAPSTPNAMGELARASDAFVDMVGVNGHLNYEGSTYSEQFDAMAEHVAELGLRHWRDALSVTPAALDRQRVLSELGVKLNLIVHELDISATLAAAKLALPFMTSIEGPNELDHGYRNGLPAFPDASTRTYQGIGFPGVVAAFQNDLYAAIKADPETAGLEVLMAGFSFPDNTLDVGLVEGCDCGNTHSYPDGGLPTFRLDDWYIPRMQVNSGLDKPLCATETGYHTTPMPDGGHWIPPVSERAASKYDLRLFFEYFNRGFRRVYLYEFADVAASAQAADLNFGLLRSDGTPKAQFFALKALFDLLRDPGPAFAPARLDYTITGGVQELSHTLLQKRDGSFYLVLWLNSLSYDTALRQDLDATCTVNIALRAPVASVTAHRPVEAAAPVSYGSSRSIDIQLADQPVVLEIK